MVLPAAELSRRLPLVEKEAQERAKKEEEMREALATTQFQTQPDPLINQIEDLLNQAPSQQWTGTATELLAELPANNRPAKPNKLSEHLKLAKHPLLARRIEVTFDHRNTSRPIHLKKTPSENQSSPGCRSWWSGWQCR